MRKKVLLASFVALIAVTLWSETPMVNQTNELAKENLEALANGNASNRIYIPLLTCYCSFDNEGSGSKTAYDCGTCVKVYCTAYYDQKECSPGNRN